MKTKAEYARDWRSKNTTRVKELNRECYERCWENSTLVRIRNRCKKEGIPFDLTIEDVKRPELCPYLGVPLEIATRYSPSVDRKQPKLGYVKGNVEVISFKANQMKSDATIEELLSFAKGILNRFSEEPQHSLDFEDLEIIGAGGIR